MLKLEKLSCYFESFDTNFNLEITKKGVVGVVGRSGSGKSTLLNLIAGFIKPQSGKIIYKSLILNNLEPAQRDLSILFQSFNNFDHLTIFENVILGIDPQMKKTSTNLKIVRDILKKLSINLDINTQVNLLSGGEQQRVAIARALLNNPKLIIADEPTGNLDPETSKEIMQLFKKLHEGGISIIMATHDYNMIIKFPGKIFQCNNETLEEVVTKNK